MKILRDFSISAAYMGVLAGFIGISSSFAIIVSGLKSVGADQNQIAVGLMFSCLIMGLLCVYWGIYTRLPVFAAWSLPGAALFSTMSPPENGFPEIIGALFMCAGMLLITGLIRPIGKMVERIPTPIANAMLAGILLKICIAPAVAVGEMPLLALPICVAWLVGLFFNKALAVPFALIAFIFILVFMVDLPQDSSQILANSAFPDIKMTIPVFTVSSVFSIAFPLYMVTMASQNIPGIAVMKIHDIKVPSSPLIRDTAILSLLAAPFGSFPANLSALVSSMCSGEETHKDPKRRYWASITCGLTFMASGLGAGLLVATLTLAPELLIASVAGLALIPVITRAITGAVIGEDLRDIAAITFIITASGMSLLGISGAFWGLLIGITLTLVKKGKENFSR